MSDLLYKAFISYRHVSPDKEIAARLHSLIENYHIPSNIRKKLDIKKMGRVFRDEEELPLSVDLGGDIEEALRNSEWLIVVCSPAYLESRWCKAELDYFISLGRRDHILTVLVNGEPDAAFPEQLRYVTVNGTIKEIEPLAADVRSESLALSLKKLNDEKLRILAPMLGVTFDDLRQRAHRRQLNIILGSGLLIILALSGFIGFALYKNGQISRQRDIAMDNQMQLLIQEANKASSEGNKVRALKILDDAAQIRQTVGKKNDREYASALEYALYNQEFEEVLTIDTNNRYFSSLVFSHNSAYLLGITNLNSACLIDGHTGLILHTVSRANIGMLDSVGFSLDDRYFYMVDQWYGYVSVYRVEDGSLFREYSADDGTSWNIGEKVFPVDERTLLIIKPSVMVLWNYLDDTVKEILPNNNDMFESYTLPLIVDLSPDRKDVVIGSHGNQSGMKIVSLDGSRQIDLDYDHSRGYPSIMYSGNGEYVAAVSGSRSYVFSAADGSLVFEDDSGEGYIDQSVQISYDGTIILAMNPEFLKATDVLTGEELWKIESESGTQTKVCLSPDGRYVGASGGITGIFDLRSGELVDYGNAECFSYDSSMVIVNFSAGKTRLEITPAYPDSKRESSYSGILYKTPRYTELDKDVNITLIHNPGDFAQGTGNIYTSEDQKYVAYTHPDGFIEVFDVSDPDNAVNRYCHAEHCYRSVADLVFNGSLMASCGGHDPRCVLFDLSSGQITYVLAGQEYCHRAEFSKDGSKIIILCGNEQNAAYVYSTNNGNLLYSFYLVQGEKIIDIGFDEENGKVVAKLDNGQALTGNIYKDIDEMLEETKRRLEN